MTTPHESDPVAIRHPSMPGEFHVIPHGALAAHLEAGWVEAKSSEAKAAVESTASADASPKEK